MRAILAVSRLQKRKIRASSNNSGPYAPKRTRQEGGCGKDVLCTCTEKQLEKGPSQPRTLPIRSKEVEALKMNIPGLKRWFSG